MHLNKLIFTHPSFEVTFIATNKNVFCSNFTHTFFMMDTTKLNIEIGVRLYQGKYVLHFVLEDY
jgi:hypothetical protein